MSVLVGYIFIMMSQMGTDSSTGFYCGERRSRKWGFYTLLLFSLRSTDPENLL